MLTDLLPTYRYSKKLLNSRISELTALKYNLESASFNPTEDPDVIEVEARLRPLVNMYTDLAEVTKEIENYYKKTKVISMGHNKEPSHNPFDWHGIRVGKVCIHSHTSELNTINHSRL